MPLPVGLPRRAEVQSGAALLRLPSHDFRNELAGIVHLNGGRQLALGKNAIELVDHVFSFQALANVQSPPRLNTVKLPVDVKPMSERWVTACVSDVIRCSRIEPRCSKVKRFDEDIND